jgi:outer membrane protein assembly factor BamE (lipoprotein component of BamABCDE complex)
MIRVRVGLTAVAIAAAAALAGCTTVMKNEVDYKSATKVKPL